MKPVSVFTRSIGLNVNIDPATISYDPKVGVSQLQVAVNVDINDAGAVTLTNGGFTKLINGRFYSLWRDTGDSFVCKDKDLYRVNTDFSLTKIYTKQTTNWMYFCEVGKEVYFSDNVTHGVITGGIVSSWTFSDRSVSKSLHTLLPVIPAKNLLFRGGRIFFTKRRTLFWTELHLLGLFAPAHNHITFDSEINVVAQVEKGLFVSCKEKTYFLSGKDPHSYMQSMVVVGPAIHKYSVAQQTRNGIAVGLDQPSGECIFFTTDFGACIGTPDGVILPLNENTVLYPPSTKGATVLHGNQLRQVIF